VGHTCVLERWVPTADSQFTVTHLPSHWSLPPTPTLGRPPLLSPLSPSLFQSHENPFGSDPGLVRAGSALCTGAVTADEHAYGSLEMPSIRQCDDLISLLSFQSSWKAIGSNFGGILFFVLFYFTTVRRFPSVRRVEPCGPKFLDFPLGS
jgi:hypothetical protein